MIKYITIFYTLNIFFCVNIHAQNVKIILGPDQIALNQTFTITLEVQNERLRSYDQFPDIPGFEKMGTSSSSSTNIINGKYSFTQSIIQNYRALSEGTYALNAFTMTINDQEIQSPGKRIVVGPARQSQAGRSRDPFFDPFEDFFGRQEPQEFVEVPDVAFFALSSDKDEVYIGEGFNVILAFYLAETNRAELKFADDINLQLAEIKKTIRPSNCWEENFNIEKAPREEVIINKKRYGRYKIFQASFFPFNLEPISFPALPLKMVKYKVAKNPNFFGRNRQADFKIYYSKPKTVHVKELPPHPLRESVPVGRYFLEEEISNKDLQTGQSFTYNFNIKGEGNISAIEKPLLRPTTNLDFYPPNIRQNIIRSNDRVRGTKSFTYNAIPNEPGTFNLGDFISFIFFDPYKQKYDTLISAIEVVASGESKKNVAISSNDLGTFYDIIELQNNNLTPVGRGSFIQWIANVIIILLLGLTVFLMIKK